MGLADDIINKKKKKSLADEIIEGTYNSNNSINTPKTEVNRVPTMSREERINNVSGNINRMNNIIKNIQENKKIITTLPVVTNNKKQAEQRTIDKNKVNLLPTNITREEAQKIAPVNTNTNTRKSTMESNTNLSDILHNHLLPTVGKTILNAVGNDISGVAGNIGMGALEVIPSVVKYTNEANKQIFGKAGEAILNNITGNEVVGHIGKVLINQAYSNSDLAKVNKTLNDALNNEEAENWRNQVIQANIDKTSNPITNKLAQLAPSIGQNALPMAVTAVNPLAGSALFMTSAAGNYLDEAKERGMNDEDALAYASIMGALEGGTESVISGNMVSKIKKLATGTELSSKILGSFGLDVTENFLQEAVMEPASEITATITGGRDKANWEDMWNRVITSGIDGALSAILMAGASIGVGKATNAVNKLNNNEQLTDTELKEAIQDIEATGKVDTKEILKNSMKSVRDKIVNSEQTNNATNTANIQTTAPYVNEKFVKQGIDKTQNNVYNVNRNEGEINGERNSKGYNTEVWTRLHEKQESNQKRQYSWEEYNNWEQSIKPINREQLTDTERKSIDYAKNKYNKDVYLYDENENNNTYSGGASANTKGKITISRQKAETFGLELMIEHENVESDIIHNEIANDIVTPVLETIVKDENFQKQKEAFWNEQDGNIPSDKSIAKDIFCDRVAEMKTGKNVDYDNVLSNATNSTIDMAINNYYKQVYGKDIENSNKGSFSMQNNTAQYVNEEFVNKSNNLVKGINQRTKNNLELNIAELPMERANVKENKITLDKDTGRLEDIIHEASHYAENNSKGYEALKDYVLTELEKTGELDNIKNDIQNRYEEVYKQEGREFTENDLNSEIIAKYSERFINDEVFVNRIAKIDRNFAQKIYDWIKDKVNYYKKIANMDYEQRQDYRNLRQAEQLWEKALKGVKGVGENNSNITNTQYHISKNFANEIEDTLNNKLPSNNQVKARDYTPEILVRNGVKNLPMLITQNHIRSTIYTLQEAQKLNLPTKNTNYHGLGKELLIKAIDNLDNPQAIYKMNDNNYLVVTEIFDNNGKEIIVPIQINGKGRYNNVFIDENQIKSAYGKNNLVNYLKNNNFEEIYNKNEESDFNEGIQYSNVADSSINNSIASVNTNVNTTDNNYMQKSKNVASTSKNKKLPKYSLNENSNESSFSIDNKGRKLSKEQQEYFKDSKILDRNGLLLTVYHGTNEEFNIFDKEHVSKNTKNAGLYGDGFYFTPDKDSARQYGKKSKEVYLDIKNPFSFSELSKINGEDYYSDYVQIMNLVELNHEWGNIPVKFGDKNTWKDINNDVKKLFKENKTDEEIDNYMYDKYGEITEKINDRLYNYSKRNNYKTLSHVLEELGYDGIINRETPENSTEIIAFHSNQIKNVDNTKPTSNPDIRYSLKDKINDVKSELKDNENISRFYENVATSKVISDEIKDKLNPKSYRKLTNDEAMETAISRLNNNPNEETKWWAKEANETNAIDVAEGLALLSKYQSEGNNDKAVSIIEKLRKIATEGGRQVQIYSLLQRLTPDGMVEYAKRTLEWTKEKAEEFHNKKWLEEHAKNFELTEEDEQFIRERMEKVAGMEDGRNKQILLAEIQKRISEKLPPDKGASIKAYMRISMLLNPKTLLRNVLGNAVIAPVNMVADAFGTVADKAVSKTTNVRTKGLTDMKSVKEGMITGVYKSFDDFRRGINTREVSGDKFEFGKNVNGKSFTEKTKLGKVMNSLDNILNFALDVGDRPFYEGAFLNSLNNQMKLNEVTKPTAEMIEIATDEALQRTWQDDNNYTKFVLALRRTLNLKIGNSKGMRYGLGDVAIPFAKTPANLTKAIVDYSPAGLTKTIIKDAKNLNNAISKGKDVAKLQHKFVDNLGKGFAGTLLYVLGYALAKAGITSGENDDDKDVANFMRNTLGIQPYSVRIGEMSFTYDWAQPVAVPFSIMANFEKYNKENPDTDALTKAIQASIIGSEQLLEQSFMQSLNEILNGNNGSFLENLTSAILDLPARAVPTLFKQVADMVDDTKRTTFDKTNMLQTAANKVIAKLPVASRTLAPTVDTLGREVKKYGGDNNPFNVFLNPTNVNKGELTESAQEIYDIYQKTGDKTIFPIQAPYSVMLKDNEKVELNPYKRADYQKSTGKYADNTIKSLLGSKDYSELNTDKKVDILKNVVTDSNLNAKKEILNYETDNKTEKEKADEKGITLPNMYIYRDIINRMESEKDKNGDTIAGTRQSAMAGYIMAMNTSNVQKNKLLAEITTSENKVTVADLNTIGLKNYTQYFSITNNKSKEKYKQLISTGINTTQLNKYWNEIDKIEGKKDANGKTISGSVKEATQNYINSLNITFGEKLLLYASTGKYTLTYNEKLQLFNYIKGISGMTNTEKQELVKSLKCFQE